MFTKIIAWIKGAWEKMIGKDTVKTKLNIDIAISSEMSQAIELWAQIYQDNAPWKTADIKSLRLGSALASELARMVTIEMKSEVTGSARADYINAQHQRLVQDLRKQVEYGLAKGGLVIKPYIQQGQIAYDYIQADAFFPSAYDGNGNITAAVFVEQITKNSKVYTRLEYHNFNGNSELITNTAFVSDSTSELGRQINLQSVAGWEALEPEVTVSGIKRPLFAYFKAAAANTIDTKSPLGASIYAKSVDLIQDADKQWSRFNWEMESGERALYADITAFKVNETGTRVLPNKRLYKTLDVQNESFFHDWTPEMRVDPLLKALDAMLKRIEFNTGLAYGTISDPQTVDRTATEVIQARQRSYSTVLDNQKSLQSALEHVVYIMDVLCTLYGLAPIGKYETSFEWDDSIVTDRDKQFTELQMLQTMGIISKEKVYAWYFGTSEEEAALQVPKTEAMAFGGAV